MLTNTLASTLTLTDLGMLFTPFTTRRRSKFIMKPLVILITKQKAMLTAICTCTKTPIVYFND
ncbi:hypothetical protein C0J52_10414 [Blattella germanica]|nr:hypothetical protein C0J52_10414 [Blattella germanica]